MSETAVGHGTRGSEECLPPSKHVLRRNRLDGLRCGSLLVEPGGLKEGVVHVWRHRGRSVRIEPARLPCDGDGAVFVSELPMAALPADPEGVWSCITETRGGQPLAHRLEDGVKVFELTTRLVKWDILPDVTVTARVPITF